MTTMSALEEKKVDDLTEAERYSEAEALAGEALRMSQEAKLAAIRLAQMKAKHAKQEEKHHEPQEDELTTTLMAEYAAEVGDTAALMTEYARQISTTPVPKSLVGEKILNTVEPNVEEQTPTAIPSEEQPQSLVPSQSETEKSTVAPTAQAETKDSEAPLGDHVDEESEEPNVEEQTPTAIPLEEQPQSLVPSQSETEKSTVAPTAQVETNDSEAPLRDHVDEESKDTPTEDFKLAEGTPQEKTTEPKEADETLTTVIADDLELNQMGHEGAAPTTEDVEENAATTNISTEVVEPRQGLGNFCCDPDAFTGYVNDDEAYDIQNEEALPVTASPEENETVKSTTEVTAPEVTSPQENTTVKSTTEETAPEVASPQESTTVKSTTEETAPEVTSPQQSTTVGSATKESPPEGTSPQENKAVESEEGGESKARMVQEEAQEAPSKDETKQDEDNVAVGNGEHGFKGHVVEQLQQDTIVEDCAQVMAKCECTIL